MIAVLDTNVLVSALRSKMGASNVLVRKLAAGEFTSTVSTALLLEYDDVLHRRGMVPTYSPQQIDLFIDSVCSASREAYIYFRWRPFLPDPKDDLVLECALAGGASHIVTHNIRDFPNIEQFGLSLMTPAQFLANLHS